MSMLTYAAEELPVRVAGDTCDMYLVEQRMGIQLVERITRSLTITNDCIRCADICRQRCIPSSISASAACLIHRLPPRCRDALPQC
jgi:hypothetical protein